MRRPFCLIADCTQRLVAKPPIALLDRAETSSAQDRARSRSTVFDPRRPKDTMLTANRLEKIMELEENLRSEYQEQLDAGTKEIERLTAEREAMKTELQATIDKQLESIKELSAKAKVNERAEQHNRELTNRSEKQQAELGELKKRVKTLQRDLAEVRAENKTLTQYDPARMKKNLDAGKKKLAEKQKANETLQKSLKQTKNDNAELQQKLAELEAKLAALEASADDADDTETPEDEKAAA